MTGIFSALVVLKQDTLAISLSHRCLPASLPMASREDARHSAATSARSPTTLPRMHPLRLPNAPSACPGIVVTCPAIRSRLALRLGARIEAISGSLPKLVHSRRATLRGPRGRLAGIPLRLVPGGLRRGLCLLGRMALAVRSQAQHPLQSKRQASWSGRLKFETLTSMLQKPRMFVRLHQRSAALRKPGCRLLGFTPRTAKASTTSTCGPSKRARRAKTP